MNTFRLMIATLSFGFMACAVPNTVITNPVTTNPNPINAAPLTATPEAGNEVEAAAAKQFVWWRGVNLAGAEFAESQIPGKRGRNFAGGDNYEYPNQAQVDYFASKGMNIFRLPFLWERIQPALFNDFNKTEIGLVDEFVRLTTAKGKLVILDPHNYARYGKGRPPAGAPDPVGNFTIGSSAVPYAAFNDLWRRLANRYKSNNRVIFNLMNEPYQMPTANWVKAANGAIAAIRKAQGYNLILVPGNRYTGAWSWNRSDENGASNAEAMLGIKDVYNWTWFEAHQYLDLNGSSVPETCDSTNIGTEPLRDFTKWLRDNGKKGFLGEFGIQSNPNCNQALESMLKYLEDNGDVWRGWTYWAAGPDSVPLRNGFSLEPVNGVDAAQFAILRKYLP